MRGPGGRPFPVRLLVVAGLLMLVCSGLSLDRADKLASIAALFVGLTGLIYTNRQGGGEASADAAPVPVPGGAQITGLLRGRAVQLRRLVLGGPRIPLGAAVAAAVAVGLIGVTVTYLAGSPDSAPSTRSVSPSPSPSPSSEPSPSPPSDPASATPDVVDCSPTAVPPTASPSTSTVRRQARLKLPAHYHADLDSTCPDWGVESGWDSARHDIVNDGFGVFRSSTDTKIARLERGKAATYEECLGNTDYLASTVTYAALKPGDRFCVKTVDRNTTRQSLLTVVSQQRSESGRTVVVDVRTWATTRPADGGDDSWAIAAGIVVALVVLGGGGGAAAASKQGKGKKKRARKEV